MDQETSLSWSGQLQESLVHHDDEFSNLLEFGMQFSDLDGQDSSQRLQLHSVSHPASMPPTSTSHEFARMDTDMSYDRVMDNFSVDVFSNQNGLSQDQVEPSYPDNANMPPQFYARDTPQHQQYHVQPPPQKHQHLRQQQSHQPSHQQPSSHQYAQPVVPPTPNSIELHGSAARYPQQVDENHELYDRYTHMNDEQALFTPLISPAMTPLETQFRLPEYTVPGEYFTPLTSPALEAQNQNANSNGCPPHLRQIPNVGYMQSPVDNPPPASSAPSSPGITRKHRRQPSATNRFATRAKKQSPSVRPQSRKKSLLNVNSDELLSNLRQNKNGPQSRTNANGGLRYDSNESTGQDSVSPEPLSEPLMPPPALPPPKPSPSAVPQMPQSRVNEAATPSTLMRIRRSQCESQTQFPGQGDLVTGESCDDIMEDIALPEAMAPTTPLYRPNAGRIEDVSFAKTTGSTTPASVTPSLEPKSAAVERTPSSIAPSPRTLAMPSPSGPRGKKSEPSKTSSSSRKRQSLSSTQPSPQLRPKISPNIQPSVRGSDGVSNETSALYLASKSNYQHILDGTLLPGVSYPETLAENLTSKRTNHKLAEQGRRNRINNALKEIEALVPQEFINMRLAKEASPRAPTGIEKEKEKTANQTISKASAVEMAIDYIKALKQELEETKGKLAATEARLGAKEAREDDSANATNSKST